MSDPSKIASLSFTTNVAPIIWLLLNYFAIVSYGQKFTTELQVITKYTNLNTNKYLPVSIYWFFFQFVFKIVYRYVDFLGRKKIDWESLKIFAK